MREYIIKQYSKTKSFKFIIFLLTIIYSTGFSQSQRFEVHTRGMLHQSVFNTGDLGRALDNGRGGATVGQPSFEWPGKSRMIIDGIEYKGQYNSFGGGLYIAADTGIGSRTRKYVQCGAASTSAGQSITVENVFSFPVSLERKTNFPLLTNGQINPNYNPNEAEEIIISKWDTPLGITVTRTSRAWSFPDYDDFIIYEYELENTGNRTTPSPPYRIDTLRMITVAWAHSLAPSMFAGERVNNNVWLEGSYRSDKPDVSKMSVYGRYDWRRYMNYNHQMDGVPDLKYFDLWASSNINGGGLTAPQAVGFLPLYYDYDKLIRKNQGFIAMNQPGDTNVVWDPNAKLKQPYCIRWDNGNLDLTKLRLNLNPGELRYVAPFRGSSDSINFGTYMIGRGKPNWTASLRNPTGKIFSYGPYNLLPGEKIYFVMAEVAGFGAGVETDSQYIDLGGGWGNNGTPTEPSPGTHPVPSWYNTLKYNFLNNKDVNAVMGSNYLKKYSLPDYVNSKVISIRDVADRAIQMYTGRQLVKYDTSQYEPSPVAFDIYPPAPKPFDAGRYSTIPIPCPAPEIIVRNTIAASNMIIWGPQVESFNTPRMAAPFSHYLLLVSNSPIGPWKILDSIGIRDPRYFRDTVGLGNVTPLLLPESAYVYIDHSSDIGAGYYYSVVSVDTSGGWSGKTNLYYHVTQAPAAAKLGKVYASPNPFVVSSLSAGTSIMGDISNKVGFFGLPARCTIRIFTYVGQLVATIEHDSDEYSTAWFQVSQNNQWIASGVYYFVVEDFLGNRAWNKFVVIH